MFSIVIRMARSETSVYVLRDRKRRILIMDFMARSDMNWNLKYWLFDTLAIRIEICSEINGSGWLNKLNKPVMRSTSFCWRINVSDNYKSFALELSHALILSSSAELSSSSCPRYLFFHSSTPRRILIYWSSFERFERIIEIAKASSTYREWFKSFF